MRDILKGMAWSVTVVIGAALGLKTDDSPIQLVGGFIFGYAVGVAGLKIWGANKNDEE